MGIKVIYTNERGDSIEFSNNTGLYITGFDSLSSNTVSFSESTPQNKIGTIHTSSIVGARTFTISGRFKKDEAKRQQMINIISPGSQATLRYIDEVNSIDVFWTGRVEKTPDIGWTNFWQEFQFIFKAFYPYARESNSLRIDAFKKEARFSFPETFYSEYEEDPVPYMFSYFRNSDSVRFYRDQDYDQGMELNISIETGGISSLTITHMKLSEDTEKYSKLALTGIGEVVKEGQTIEISTYPSNLYIRVKETGENLMKYVSPYSTFIKIHNGYNQISYDVDTTTDATVIYMTVFLSDEVVGI